MPALMPSCFSLGLPLSWPCLNFLVAMKERFIPEVKIIRLLRQHYSGCCNSCHDDMDGGDGSGIEIDLGKGRWSEVCCKVSLAFEKLLKDRLEKKIYVWISR